MADGKSLKEQNAGLIRAAMIGHIVAFAWIAAEPLRLQLPQQPTLSCKLIIRPLLNLLRDGILFSTPLGSQERREVVGVSAQARIELFSACRTASPAAARLAL